MVSTEPIKTPWVKSPNPNLQARFRLFCFPHAGGGASLFRNWADLLPREVEVCAVQLPGREDRLREPPFTRLPQLIESLAHALQPYVQERPYAFFGHSMGGYISFELARYLRSHLHTGPSQLFIAATRAPQLPDRDPPVHALPEKEFIEKLHQLNGTPIEILQNPEILEIALPLLRADFAVCETYSYLVEYPLSCPICVYGGTDDKEVTYADMAAWSEHTQASFKQLMFPGDHFFFSRNPTDLLQVISRELMRFLNPRNAPTEKPAWPRIPSLSPRQDKDDRLINREAQGYGHDIL